jgi:hypothetical protein
MKKTAQSLALLLISFQSIGQVIVSGGRLQILDEPMAEG